jgi:hypothetical protein
MSSLEKSDCPVGIRELTQEECDVSAAKNLPFAIIVDENETTQTKKISGFGVAGN